MWYPQMSHNVRNVNEIPYGGNWITFTMGVFYPNLAPTIEIEGTNWHSKEFLLQ